ncbi:MAG: DUF3052 domain-containing protein, partial [Acidimicrobiales bacterium]
MEGPATGTPLVRKLAIGPGAVVALVNAPPNFPSLLEPLPPGVIFRSRAGRGPCDVVVAFFTRRAELARRVPALARALAPAGGLWLAWPKKASGVATDVTFDVVQPVGLATGLVDNKVCAIDDT